MEMPTDQSKGERLTAEVARISELTKELNQRYQNLEKILMEALEKVGHKLEKLSQSPFSAIGHVLMERGNLPMTASEIMKVSGVSRSALSQVLHKSNKELFISLPIPGYSKKKLWALSEIGKDAAQLGKTGIKTLFGQEGEFSGVKAVECCFRILRERGNQPMNALAMAREAIRRGYRGKTKGDADEVLLTTAKSFWAALGRDQRFEEVRPLVFKLKEEPPKTPK